MQQDKLCRYDYGTTELRAKRFAGLTAEPLDLCMQKGLIEKHHHRAGNYLRWLRTTRFGLSHIRAHDCFDLGGIHLSGIDDEKYLAELNQRYIESTKLLDEINANQIVMSVCVYMERPKFLNCPKLAHRSYELKLLQKGLTELAKFYEFYNDESPL